MEKHRLDDKLKKLVSMFVDNPDSQFVIFVREDEKEFNSIASRLNRLVAENVKDKAIIIDNTRSLKPYRYESLRIKCLNNKSSIDVAYLRTEKDATMNWCGTELTGIYWANKENFSDYQVKYLRTRLRSRSILASFEENLTAEEINNQALE